MRALLLATLLACSAAAPAFAAPASADGAEGDWLVQNGEAKVRIAPCAGHADRLCGTIDWLRSANDPTKPKQDVNNPNPSLRARPLMGLQMLWDFQRGADGRWTGGKIYDPKSGKTYASKLGLNPDGTLKVQGCVAMFCQSQTWKRV